MFPSTYLKPVMVNGKPMESDLSSVVTNTNHIGLRQHLASNNKILLNGDADLIAKNYGLYNVNDYTKEHERNIILCGYAGFTNTSRTTGTTIIQISDKRLTIAIATTGGKLMKNMKNWINCTGYDGSHNRFLYMSIPKLIYSRPQDFKVNINSKKNPSLAHLCVIVHLFGTIRYVFQMSESERTKFYGAVFDQVSVSVDEDEQTQTQQHRSAMFIMWNLIADLVETKDQKQNEQQQIVDFYAKSGTTFPRLVCLLQLYFNAIDILDQVKETVSFAEGDNEDMIINENFINSVQNIIKKDYHLYDKTYLSCNQINQAAIDPMIIVEKSAGIAAWKWYKHHLNISSILFTIDHEFSGKSISLSSTLSLKPKTLKQLIMLFDFNIFPLAAISCKHPVTGQTGIIKNRPALGERALQELINDNLLKFNCFLTDVRGRNVKSYIKMPIPSSNDLTRKQFIKNLLNHEINVDEYYSNYEKASMPSNNYFSKLTLKIFQRTASFITEYSKYRSQLGAVIEKHFENCSIVETEDGYFIIKNQQAFGGQCHDIENLVLGERLEQINNRSPSMNLINQSASKQTEKSTVESKRRTTTEISFLSNPVEKNCEIQHHSLTEIPVDEQEPVSTISKQNADELFLHDNVDDANSNVSTQQTIHEVTNTYEKGVEQMIKKTMQNIMTGRSVLYTKTDLTQICNKPVIRLEAVKRLVSANLLQHEDHFWIEPNRTKKESNKISKRLLREGWLKKGPETTSDVSKFRFIQVSQENTHQIENVFTHNNRTLSDELIELIRSNFFYAQHVRWNVQRFRPSDVTKALIYVENQAETLSTQDPNLSDPAATTENNNQQDMIQQQVIINNDEEEITHIGTMSTRSQ
ncbi:unnamed protein product [Rotaria magnacalcarata]|uniref:Uncharacterized protein n=2 Tax=Rotaria magnacalcarata TaxID=392030 RepID=A0A816H8B0_9BILA|nr:unnamed protein product [Rotaria magnacalcarata]CAF4003652.1 unnamed protein product [Rotaria magnacalcarata]